MNSTQHRIFIFICVIIFSCANTNKLNAQKPKPSLAFTVSLKEAAAHLYHVVFRCKGIKQQAIEFKIPVWTPGYYQILDFPENIQNFAATNNSGKLLKWEKTSKNGWTVQTENVTSIVLSYDVKATRSFVATNYLDEDRGYLSPTGVFLHPAGIIKNPITITIEPAAAWNIVATGLDSVKGKRYTFTAPDYDVLYDSPFLMGKLESFPSFSIKGKPHYFVAFKPGEFDKAQFMADMKKIVTTASGIIGDIPYNHYSFLGIGPGGGGIEHLNSASVAFSGNGLNTKEGKIRMYNFLAHEYFHHYNVKRIRPIELGPFDYDNGSVTKMLWLSEGVTVYYEYLILKRAGFTTADDVLKSFQESIKEYESKPGRFFQTSAEASFTTWEDGPFGRTGDDLNKTISPYDKGPALGIMLDFKIRHETKNKKSLDDLMRLLYNKYYKQKGRGFTEDEFRKESETIAGTSLADFFDYIYTLKQVDYPMYLNYAGLAIDTIAHELPGAWLGIKVKDKNDSLFITNTEWQSPAWDAGLRNRTAILKINDTTVNAKTFNDLLASSKPGDKIKILFSASGIQTEKEITLGIKKESSYAITRISNPDSLQKIILKSWLGE